MLRFCFLTSVQCELLLTSLQRDFADFGCFAECFPDFMSKLADLNISELEVFLLDEGIAGHSLLLGMLKINAVQDNS